MTPRTDTATRGYFIPGIAETQPIELTDPTVSRALENELNNVQRALDATRRKADEMARHMALARSEAGCPDDETLVIHCQELRAAKREADAEIARLTKERDESQSEWSRLIAAKFISWNIMSERHVSYDIEDHITSLRAEIAALKEDRDEFGRINSDQCALAELAKARKDTERVNKIEELARGYRDHAFGLIASEAPTSTPGWKYFVKGHEGPTLRDAIDRAQE